MVEKIAHKLTRNPRLVALIAVLLLIPSALGYIGTRVNYDILTYLPQDLESSQGERLLEEPFHMAATSMLIVEDMPAAYTNSLIYAIRQVPNVSNAVWLSNAVGIQIPIDFIPANLRDMFYAGDATMIIIQYDKSGADEDTMKAIQAVRDICNEKCFLAGFSVVIKDTKDLVDRELPVSEGLAVLLSLMAMSLTMDYTVLPFVFLTALALLYAILGLVTIERLEEADKLASLRESYYQGLRREESQLRTLRHDLRNHLTALRGLVELGEDGKALQYIDQLADSSALRGGRRLCENDTANAVLSAKAETMGRMGLTADFSVSLPKVLPLAEVDLCALLGNAADNAMEAAEGAEDKTVTLRCRAEKGLFMLRVENAYAGELAPDLATTKADRTSHGFGLAGMREIAERLGGSLETRAGGGPFQLVVCLPLPRGEGAP